jgi:hypothetical protein
VTRSGEPKFPYSRFSRYALVRTALQGSLTLEGLFYLSEARTRVGKPESVADHVSKATKAARFLITGAGGVEGVHVHVIEIDPR